MKTTGIVRPMDRLGRIVIPKPIRRKLGIMEMDQLEMYVDGTNIVLKKYVSVCAFCGGESDLEQFKGKNVCATCLEGLRNQKPGIQNVELNE